MSAVVNTQQSSLTACISSARMAQGPTTCCSQTKSSEVLEQHHKTQLRMLSHRWQRLGLQAPIHWDTQEHTPQMKNRPALEIRPIKVSSIVSPKSESPDDKTIKTIVNSICGSSNNEHLEGNAAERSVESENSDLSDQEKDSFPLLKWETPVELDLRPDSSNRDLEPTEIGEGEQVYPEILPFSLKDFELSQLLSEADDLESQHNLCITDPCLAALASRMIKLEKLQIATIQKEQGKVVRSRPATALLRSGNRVRPVESSCSQANLNEITKLTLSSNSYFKSMNRNRLSPNAGKVWIGFQQPLTLPKKPHSGVVRVKKTEGLVHNVVVYANKSPKCSTPDSSKRCKSTKKAMPKPQKSSSEKTSVPAKAPCRKT